MSLIISTFYRESPREAALIVGGGVTEVTNRQVLVTMSTLDHVTGFNNVTSMKLWGSFDPNFQPECYGTTEADARWVQFEPSFAIILSAGNGAKTIHAKMRNSSEVESAELIATVTLNAQPHPSVLWTDEQDLPAASGVFQFGWSSSHDWDTFAVVQAPTDDATFDESESLYEQMGPGTAGTAYTVAVDMPEFAARDIAPTQSGAKIFRLFLAVGTQWYSTNLEPDPFRVGVWDESVWDGDDRWE